MMKSTKQLLTENSNFRAYKNIQFLDDLKRDGALLNSLSYCEDVLYRAGLYVYENWYEGLVSSFDETRYAYNIGLIYSLDCPPEPRALKRLEFFGIKCRKFERSPIQIFKHTAGLTSEEIFEDPDSANIYSTDVEVWKIVLEVPIILEE